MYLHVAVVEDEHEYVGYDRHTTYDHDRGEVEADLRYDQGRLGNITRYVLYTNFK